jgi:hypothetical protein
VKGFAQNRKLMEKDLQTVYLQTTSAVFCATGCVDRVLPMLPESFSQGNEMVMQRVSAALPARAVQFAKLVYHEERSFFARRSLVFSAVPRIATPRYCRCLGQ